MDALKDRLQTRTYGGLLQDTIHAIYALKNLGDRAPTEQEAIVLAKFGGFGPLAELFRNTAVLEGQNLEGQRQLRSLLDEVEFGRARDSVPTAYYTPPAYIPLLWQAAARLVGTDRPLVLDPGCGIGNFALHKPDNIIPKDFYGVEREPISAAIAKKLGWGRIYNKDFFEWGCPLKFDLGIGNIPFTDGVRDTQGKFSRKVELHARFFIRVLEVMAPGGIVLLATTTNTLDSTGGNKEYEAFRRYLDRRARFLGAVRLPQDGFKSYRTSACVDIVVLQVREPGDDRLSKPWHTTAPTSVISHTTGKPCRMNQYFTAHPHHLLGELGLDKLTGDKAVVTAAAGQDTLALLRAALDNIINL